MSDPSTLLLLTCAACAQPPSPMAQAEHILCAPERQEARGNPVEAAAPTCISPPETLVVPAKLVSAKASHKPVPVSVGELNGGNYSPSPAPPEHSFIGPDRVAPSASPISPSRPVLRRGSQGEAVILLQTRLKHLGYGIDAIDGRYGPITQRAVIQFQKAQNLEADGIVGFQTWSTLEDVRSPSSSLNDTTSKLNPGSTLPLASSSSRRERIPVAEPVSTLALASSGSVTTGTNYIWVWVWVVVYAGGWVVILKDHVRVADLIHQVKREFTKKGLRRTTTGDRTLTQPPMDETSSEEDPGWSDADGETAINSDSSFVVGGPDMNLSFILLAPEPAPSPAADYQDHPAPKDALSDALVREPQIHRSKQVSAQRVAEPLHEENILQFTEIDEPELEIAWAEDNLKTPLEDGVFEEDLAPWLHSSEMESGAVPSYSEVTEIGYIDEDIETNTVADDPAATVVATLAIQDADPEETYTYALVEDAGGRFVLEGNELRIADPALVKETLRSNHTVTIRCTDARGNFVDQLLKIARVRAFTKPRGYQPQAQPGYS